MAHALTLALSYLTLTITTLLKGSQQRGPVVNLLN